LLAGLLAALAMPLRCGHPSAVARSNEIADSGTQKLIQSENWSWDRICMLVTEARYGRPRE